MDPGLRALERKWLQQPNLGSLEAYRRTARRAGQDLDVTFVASAYEGLLEALLPGGLAVMWDEVNYQGSYPEELPSFLLEIFWYADAKSTWLPQGRKCRNNDIHLRAMQRDPNYPIRDLYHLYINTADDMYSLSEYEREPLSADVPEYFRIVEKELEQLLHQIMKNLGYRPRAYNPL